MKLSKKILAAICFSLTLSACKRDQLENTRTSIPELGAAFFGQNAEYIPPLGSPLEKLTTDSGLSSACERLEILGHEQKANLNYSFFDVVKVENEEIKGSVDLAQFPFAQYVLGEKFIAGNENDFYEKAKIEHEEGRLGFLKWMVVNLMKGIGLLEVVQYPTINSKLTENFPGLYGEEHDLSGSLQFKLLKKVSDPVSLAGREPRAFERLLTTKAPLFPANGSWQQWSQDVRSNWASALSAFQRPDDTIENERERVCATILAHHSFAQLMAFKGYTRPVWKLGSDGKSKLQELSQGQSEFTKTSMQGGFFDPVLGRSIVLDNVEIQNYNPSQRLLQLTAEAPNGALQYKAGNLNDALAVMEALLFNFEASSPAANWVSSEESYYFGDIEKINNRAIVPAEAHALSLGLMTMQFKNLAANHIRQVNSRGSIAGKDDLVVGIALASEPHSTDPLVRVKLEEVIRLTRVVSYLDYSLLAFTKGSPEKWARMNNVYAPVNENGSPLYKTLAAIHGEALFKKEELDRTLTEVERKNILRNNLQKLKLPLAVLLVQMGTTKAGCFTEMNWDLSKGTKFRAGHSCDAAERASLKDALTILAQDAQAPILLKKAREL